jgi:thiosulfate/3-mercaptopyruvate sulfurtransferase
MRLAQPGPLVLLDASFDLADPQQGERQYLEGHLPGAQYVHLERDLSGTKSGANGRHPLPARAQFAATAGALGIAPGVDVVVYDRQASMYAGRAWWMLLWLGHADVAVLDGGVAAWLQAGGTLVAGPAVADETGPYPLRTPLVTSIDSQTLMQQLGRARLLDARAPERFRGDVEPLDAQAGHIPGARNRFFKDNLVADGRFKPPAQLRAEFTPIIGLAPADDVVHQCGSGVTACHNVLAMEASGLGRGVLYAGSWSEWSSEPSRPVARD